MTLAKNGEPTNLAERKNITTVTQGLWMKFGKMFPLVLMNSNGLLLFERGARIPTWYYAFVC